MSTFPRGLRTTTSLRAVMPAVLFGLAASGCSSPKPVINVEAQWEGAIRNLNMFAVYPITEDVYIGDAFLYAPASGSAPDGRFHLTRIGSVEPRDCMLDALRRQQAKRLRIEPMPVDPKANAGYKPRPIAEPDCPATGATAKGGKTPALPPVDVGNVINYDAPVRMRRAAIPAFTAATITQGDLSGGGFFGPVAAAFGLSASADTAISVTLKDLEELSLDADAALQLEAAQGPAFLGSTASPGRLFEYIRQAREDLLGAFCRGDFQKLQDEQLGLIIANRVMYAHSIEYGYRADSQFGASLMANVAATNAAAVAAGLPVPGTAQPAPEATPTIPGGKVATPDAAVADMQKAQAASRAAINAAIPKTPGVTASFGLGRLGTSALTITYEKPLAVGVGAPITMSIGEVMSMHSEIIAGTFPRSQVDRYGAPTAQYLRLREAYAALQAPLRQSLANTVRRCAAYLAGAAPGGTKPKSLADILRDATTATGTAAGTPTNSLVAPASARVLRPHL